MRPRVLFINRYFFPDHSATSQLLGDLSFSLAEDLEVLVITSRLRYGEARRSLSPDEQVDRVTVRRVIIMY